MATADNRTAVRPANSVLLADDDAASRSRLVTALDEWGYTVTAVKDGAAAMAALAQSAAPRLAILDWEMPSLSGVQVCRLVRSRPKQAYTYVILLSGRDNQKDVLAGLAAGADDYIRKPFEPEELKLRLRAGQRIVELQDALLKANAALEQRALYDALTGTKNRGAILEVLEQELSRSTRHLHPVCIALADLDHFKRINDTYGHPAGDAVLAEFARRAKVQLRKYDSLGRFGGEEFLLVIPQARLAGGIIVAQRLQRALAGEPITLPGGERITVTASFGVACTEGGTKNAASLITAADKALYTAKANGRNRVYPELE